MTGTASPVRSPRADTTALTAGTIGSGLAAYGFVAVGTRSVGAEAFAPVSVLWSLWALSAAAITFPVQHWVIRTVEASGDERAVWAAAPSVWAATGLAGALVLGGTGAVAEPLFGRPGMAFPVMAACLPVGSVLMGFNRGVLAARGRFGATALALLGENVLRLVLALVAMAAVGSEGLGWILVAGFAVAVLWPRTVVHRRPTGEVARPPMSLLGGLAAANVAAQTVLTSGPIVLSLLGGDPVAVTTLFAVLAILRAPHVVAVGVTARLMAPLTRLAAMGDRASLRRTEHLVGWTTLGVAGIGVAVGPWVLPAVTELVFGVGEEIPAAATALLTAGGVVAVAGVVQMLVLLAEGRGRELLRAWLVALVVGAGMLVLPWDPVTRVAAAFAAAEVLALVLMFVRVPTEAADTGGVR